MQLSFNMTLSARRSRSLTTSVLLVIALVFAQQIGIMHAFGHVRNHGATHEHAKGVRVIACDECLAFAQIQPAPGLVTVPFQGVSPHGLPPETVRRDSPHTPSPSPFRSRAPPFHV